jgi:hypothetical protein
VSNSSCGPWPKPTDSETDSFGVCHLKRPEVICLFVEWRNHSLLSWYIARMSTFTVSSMKKHRTADAYERLTSGRRQEGVYRSEREGDKLLLSSCCEVYNAGEHMYCAQYLFACNFLLTYNKNKQGWLDWLGLAYELSSKTCYWRKDRMRELMGRQGRRRKQLVDDIKKTRVCWKLKKKDCTLWRTRFGRGCGPVIRETIECKKWVNDWI